MPQAKILTYRIWLTKEPEGGYTVTVPSLPGCVTFGDSVDEAIVMAREAIDLYIEKSRSSWRSHSHRRSNV